MTAELKELYRSAFSRLCSYAAILLGSEQEAEDVVSDVFLTLLQLPDLNIDNVEAYVTVCIRNRCLQILRGRKGGEARLKLAEMISESTPDLSCIQQENDALFEKALGGLPEMTRKVFIMNKQEGYSYKEIAARLKISESTVRVHIFCAIRSLTKQLENNLTNN